MRSPMRSAVLAALPLLAALLAGCADPPADTGNPEDLTLATGLAPMFVGGPNIADAPTGKFQLGAACMDAADCMATPYNTTRFSAQWTITVQGVEGVLATGAGASIEFPTEHASVYEGKVHLHDTLLNETVFEKTGMGTTTWMKEVSVDATPGPAGRVAVMDIVATITGQTLAVEGAAESNFGPSDGAFVVVHPDDTTEEQLTSGASAKLGAPGTYRLEWEPQLPFQTPATVTATATLSYGEMGHDMMDMGGAGGEETAEPEPSAS